MYYYFSAKTPSALKINGAYFGVIGETPKLLRTEIENSLLEVCPLNENQPNLNFILDGALLACPPKRISVTDLKGGYLIKINAQPIRHDFCVIKQSTYENHTVTLFYDNGLKLSVQSPNDFYIESVDGNFDDAKIEFFNIAKKNMIAVQFIGEENLLKIFLIEETISHVFCAVCNEFETDERLIITNRHQDVLKHTVKSFYDFSESSFTFSHNEIEKEKPCDKNQFNSHVLPFVFFEQILVGDDVALLATQNITGNLDALKSYLGDFIGIIPPPQFIEGDFVGLVYKKIENLYYVNYFSTEQENGLISNVIKKDE